MKLLILRVTLAVATAACCFPTTVHGWQPSKPATTAPSSGVLGMNRRAILAGSFVGLLLPAVANAGIDPSLLKTLPVQGDESGAVQRLRQIEDVQRPATDLVNVPFEELPSGVSYREYREGKGEAGTIRSFRTI
jgi:hypothetical protein